MKAASAILACSITAGSALGQQAVLNIDIRQVSLDVWEATAELLNPQTTVLATISDFGFRMTATNIGNFTYNPAFDSDFFGPATVDITGNTVEFVGGNILPPLNNAGGPDSNNPLTLFQIEADQVFSFELVGQVTGAYTGVPFPEILTYQDAQGNAGNTPYRISIFPPAPGSASLLAFAGVVAVRRRR